MRAEVYAYFAWRGINRAGSQRSAIRVTARMPCATSTQLPQISGFDTPLQPYLYLDVPGSRRSGWRVDRPMSTIIGIYPMRQPSLSQLERSLTADASRAEHQP